MDKFYNKIMSELEIGVNELEIKGDCSIQRIEAIIQLIIKSLSDLKEFVLKNDFKDMEAEIYFFKYQKSVIVSKLIYYNAVYKIESKPINYKW